MKPHLLLGTAGHIDHGKTALVRALTGVDCDRLPDERRRQITIDLGFAALELDNASLGIVDVPGHERFIKNMLAGATGVDLAMLVVAADEAVKPQTREHLEILQHLRLPAGVIVVTKCDLAEEEWIDLVVAEIEELAEGTFLDVAPTVRVSAATGRGLDDLRTALSHAADVAAAARRGRSDAPLRMHIDRTFSLSGHGTVVTGSIASGRVAVGDQMTIYPAVRDVRVRGLQSHDASADALEAGSRAAINLAGVRYDEVTRGDVLAASGLLRESRTISVHLKVSEQTPRPLQPRQRVRLHLGAAEIMARVRLFESHAVQPGGSCFAQLVLAEPVAAAWGDPLVLRAVSPLDLLGGGRVLDPWAARRRRRDEGVVEHLARLDAGEPGERIAAAAWLHPTADWGVDDLFVLTGVTQPGPLLNELTSAGELLALKLPRGETAWLHRKVFETVAARIERRLTAEHRQTPLEQYVEQTRVDRYFPEFPPVVFTALLTALEQRGVVVQHHSSLALPDWSVELPPKQQTLLDEVVATLDRAGLDPPSPAQLAETLDAPLGEVAAMLQVGVDRKLLVWLSQDVYLHERVLGQARQTTAKALQQEGGLTVSEIRNLLGTTRRVAIPLCEYYDATGLTRRDGDVRQLADDALSRSTA